MTRSRATFLVFSLAAFGLAAATLAAQPAKPPQKPAAPPPSKPQGLVGLSQEVQALIALADLDLDADQLKALAKLAAGASAPETPPDDKPADKSEKDKPGDKKKISDAFQKALKDLHAALLKGDEEKIADARAKYDELRDTESPDLDDEWETTDAAKKKVGPILKLLTVRQLGGYISGLDLREPHEMLLEAFEEVHKREGEERAKYIQETSEEIAQLIAGETGPQAKRVKDQVKALLEEAANLKEEDLEKKLPELEKKAKRIAGSADCVVVLRHIMEKELAKLLSNPRLPAAIEIREKVLEKQEKSAK